MTAAGGGKDGDGELSTPSPSPSSCKCPKEYSFIKFAFTNTIHFLSFLFESTEQLLLPRIFDKSTKIQNNFISI